MQQPKSYVRTDENGAIRIGGTGVLLDSIVAAFEQGHSPETIREQYPALTLEEVYGAIAYYLANTEEVESYLRRQDALWSEWRARTSRLPPTVIERLRAKKSLSSP